MAWITNRPYYTNAGFFDQLMKYLYQNHFKVLTYRQLGYSRNDNRSTIASLAINASMDKTKSMIPTPCKEFKKGEKTLL